MTSKMETNTAVGTIVWLRTRSKVSRNVRNGLVLDQAVLPGRVYATRIPDSMENREFVVSRLEVPAKLAGGMIPHHRSQRPDEALEQTLLENKQVWGLDVTWLSPLAFQRFAHSVGAAYGIETTGTC